MLKLRAFFYSFLGFTGTISFFRAIGGEYDKAYAQCIRITSAYASIAQLTVYLNLPVDLPSKREVSRHRALVGRRERDFLRRAVATGAVVLDDNEVALWRCLS